MGLSGGGCTGSKTDKVCGFNTLVHPHFTFAANVYTLSWDEVLFYSVCMQPRQLPAKHL